MHDMRAAAAPVQCWRGWGCLQLLTCVMHKSVPHLCEPPTAQHTSSVTKLNACGDNRVLRMETRAGSPLLPASDIPETRPTAHAHLP